MELQVIPYNLFDCKSLRHWQVGSLQHQVAFFISFPNQRAIPGGCGFSDLAILWLMCRVNMQIEKCDPRCPVFSSHLLCGIHLCNIKNFHTYYGFLGFSLFIPVEYNTKSWRLKNQDDHERCGNFECSTDVYSTRDVIKLLRTSDRTPLSACLLYSVNPPQNG